MKCSKAEFLVYILRMGNKLNITDQIKEAIEFNVGLVKIVKTIAYYYFLQGIKFSQLTHNERIAYSQIQEYAKEFENNKIVSFINPEEAKRIKDEEIKEMVNELMVQFKDNPKSLNKEELTFLLLNGDAVYIRNNFKLEERIYLAAKTL